MTEIVSFVEVDVPHCTLVYGVAPCLAQLGFIDGTLPTGIGFNKAYATRGAGLSGAADSKLATGSFWFRWTGDSTSEVLYADLTAVNGTTVRFQIRQNAANIEITGRNAAGTVILNVTSSTLAFPRKWYHVLFSVDLADTAKRHLYVDDVSDLTVVTYTNDTMDFTLADASFGALGNGTSAFGDATAESVVPEGAYFDFWLKPGIYIDFSTTANRRLFIDADKRPVFLGATGQIPTGSAPLIFFGNPADTAAWCTNLGTGGGFTQHNETNLAVTKFATGSVKCFNSLGSCQDIPDFNNAPLTVRFSEDVRLTRNINKGPPNKAIATTTVTATGAGTYTVPSGVSSITIEAWGGGGAGGGPSSTTIPGGGGGGYSKTIINVNAGQTVYYNVGSGGTGAAGAGANGGNSWVNPAANSQPTGLGVIGGGGIGGDDGPAAGGTGSLGTTNYAGGTSGDGDTESTGGGGGGGAGSGANGGNAGLEGAPGTGGDPDGGAGGTGVQDGPGGSGTQPGGGAGGAFDSGNGGSGGAGQVRFSTGLLEATGSYPFITDIDLQPAIVSLGENMGQRATLAVTLKDSKHPDYGILHDHYPETRNYLESETYERGTFWSKFRARHRLLRGKPVRLIRGHIDQRLSEMETRLFIVDSINGPNENGQFQFFAKDILSLAELNRSFAPAPNTGYLNASILAAATSFDLVPTATANVEYATSGLLTIGGSEVCSFTRTNNNFNIVRGLGGTVAADHAAGERVQEMYGLEGRLTDILFDLLTNYAGVPPEYIPIETWNAEDDNFLGFSMFPNLSEPTPVNEFISSLLEQTGTALWWDDLDQLVQFQVLRSVPTTAQRYNEDNVLAGTLRITEQPEKRVSQVIVYFGRKNLSQGITDEGNYNRVQIIKDTDSELAEGASIRKVFCWAINSAGEQFAIDAAQSILSRYVAPPRRFNFEIQRYTTEIDPHLGQGGRLGGGDPQIASWPFFDATGERIDIPIQITRHNADGNRHVLEAEEMLFHQIGNPPANKTIVFDANELNVNLRTRYGEIYGDFAPVSGSTITAIINQGVIIGSAANDEIAFDVGSWPTGVTVRVEIYGRIEGRGGNGRRYQNTGDESGNGGVALYTRKAIALILNIGNAQIFGGGGGGAGGTDAGGGGGGGSLPGGGGAGTISSKNGHNATTEFEGAAGTGTGTAAAAGGGPGVNGGSTTFGSGGTAGSAIDGVSFCTKTGTGDIRGAEVN